MGPKGIFASISFLLFVFFPFRYLAAQVVLTEIMFDARGADSHDEFVEIFNLSDSVAVDVSGWQISDGDGIDTIIEVGGGTLLQPQQFAVILDPSYFSNSDTYDDLIPEESLLLSLDNLTFGSAGLSNSTAERVSIINAIGEIVSQYTYSLGNKPGFSDEKIDLAGPNSPENWSDSKVDLGTPGASNSVSPLNVDLAVFDNDILFSPKKVQSGESVLMTATVRNLGKNAIAQFRLSFFDDLDGDSVPESDERLGAMFDFSNGLLANDSTSFSIEYADLSAGTHLIFVSVEISSDEDQTNNVASRELLVRFPRQIAVLNEIMYSPSANQPEWVEIINLSDLTIDLSRWAFSDSDSSRQVFFGANSILRPGGFFVVSKDSSMLVTFNVPRQSLAIAKSFPALNNDFDSVVLYDLAGTVIDRVDYRNSWGGDLGVSLEKINPELASNGSTNWSSSVASVGGTPGEENSIFTQSLPSAADIQIEPNPFSPNNDGIDDFAIIRYELPLTTATINMKIYDLRGRLIRFLANNQASGAVGSMVWDGNDDNGQAARMGIYIVYLQALNAAAGILKTEKKTVVLARAL